MEDANDLVKILIELDSPTYRAVTLEVLALFNWMKRFVDSMIPDDKNSNQQNQDDEEANE
jgi:CRISPR-associated protein Cmr5